MREASAPVFMFPILYFLDPVTVKVRMQVDYGNRDGGRPERRKRTYLNVAVGGGGGGIGCLVLLGGGLAAAALVGAFTVIKKKKTSNRTEENENEKREGSQVQSFVPEEKPVRDGEEIILSDGRREERDISSKNDFVEVLAREGSIPMVSIGKEEEDGVIDAHEENVIEDKDEKSEEITLVYDNSDEESRAIDDNILYNEPDNQMDTDSEQNLQVRETIELVKENEAVNADKMISEDSPQSTVDHVDNTFEEEDERSESAVAAEDNLRLQTGDDDDDDDDDDDSGEEVTKEDEDSSEWAGCSSTESNVEAIWPAEVNGSPSQVLKEKIVNEDTIAQAGSQDCPCDDEISSLKPDSHCETGAQSTMIHSSNWEGVKNWSMLVLILLLLLWIVHRTAILQELPYLDRIIVT